MTDMMIGVLFIFIIMVAYFAFQIKNEKTVPFSIYEVVQKEKVKLEEEVQQLLLRIAELKAEIERLKSPNPLEQYIENSNQARNDIVEDVVRELKASNIDAEAVYQQGVVTISGKGLFANGRSDLDGLLGAVNRVNILSDTLYQRVQCFVLDSNKALDKYKQCNPSLIFLEAVFIEGHTDNQAITVPLPDGSTNNLELSSRRATNTYQQLVERNNRITSYLNPANQQVLSVAAYGEQRPIDDNNSIEGRQNNRRIDIRFVMYIPKDQKSLADFKRQFD